MLIGIDFDNTIVSYDKLFYKVALEGAHIPEDIEPTKLQVRDYLRQIDNEDIWTEMQGYVYGARMSEADAFPGVHEFMRWANQSGFDLAIVSHKTKHPFSGKKYNLHDAARYWIDENLHDNSQPYIKPDNVFFELTKEEKLNKIVNINCDYFIDDLPEILLAPGFPEMTNKILFDPVDDHENLPTTLKVKNWDEIKCLFQKELSKND